MAKEKFYITTAIIYANAKPHIGFALELLQADAIARWQRLLGKEVFFLTGSDEHGTKILTAATAASEEPQAFVDQNVVAVKTALTALNISNTDFIRTTDRARHWPTAQKIWQQLADHGDITAGHYQGYYSVTEEAYITKTDYEAGNYDPAKVVELSEDNYIFHLGNYQEPIVKALESRTLNLLPHHRASEMINFAASGLQDVSFSRPSAKMPWGIPVPGDDGQVMYVWCDALTNYLSALDYANDGTNFKKFWPADVQIIGKDILRFHALTWPGILLGLGLPLPRTLLVHGHVLSEGQKMSKSVGNVVDPIELVEKFGLDPVRYYLLGEIPTKDDGDFSATRFTEIYESDLANDLGNLLNRTLVMADKYLPNGLPKISADPFGTAEFWQDISDMMLPEALDLDKALKAIWGLVRRLNQYIDAERPWEVAKLNSDAAGLAVANLIEGLRHIGLAAHAFLPETSDRIYAQLGLAPLDEAVDTLAALNGWGTVLKSGHHWTAPSPLFPKEPKA